MEVVGCAKGLVGVGTGREKTRDGMGHAGLRECLVVVGGISG